MENFSWAPLYKELSVKLLDYKDNRSALVKWIYEDLGKVTRDDGKSLVAYLKMKDGSKIEDIDPFSVFGIFNRSTSWEKRTELLVKFKQFFNLQAEVPTDFNGIPTLDARRSFFFSWFDDNEKVIAGIWNLFEKVIKNEDIENAFNKVIENGMARYSLTMCLFWIAPQKYISLDSRNRSYLETFGFADDYPTLRYSDYTALLADIQKAIDSGAIPASSFIEFSHMAWKAATQTPRIWMWNGNEETFSESSLKMGSSAKGLVSFASYGSKEELYKRLAPVEKISLELDGSFPDISDLEVDRYVVENDKMIIRYNSNHVSSKEVLERICKTSRVKSVSVRRASLGESIKKIER